MRATTSASDDRLVLKTITIHSLVECIVMVLELRLSIESERVLNFNDLKSQKQNKVSR